jgi:hypothetical protein
MGSQQRMALGSSAPRQRADLSMRKLRSALSNGSVILGVDHRLPWMRRLKDLLSDHITDLGGNDVITHSQRMLVNRASMLCLQCEMLERRFAKSDGVASNEDLMAYQRVTNSLRRCLQVLGLERVAKDVTRLSDLLEQDHRSQHEAPQ